MEKVQELIRKAPKIWLIPICLLALLTLVGYETKRNWCEIAKLAFLFANDFEYYDSIMLMLIAVPTGYYTGALKHLFYGKNILQYEVDHQYATHILKRLVLDIDDIERRFLKAYASVANVPIDDFELVHEEISKAIDLFYFDSRRLQRTNLEPLTQEELEAVIGADNELFAKSPLKNICIQNVFDLIRLLNKR